MHRFRKKQDLKKQQFGSKQDLSESVSGETMTTPFTSPLNDSPNLLPTSDFRTSLILPTLTKRFSVLRRGEATTSGPSTPHTESGPAEATTVSLDKTSQIQPDTTISSQLKEEIYTANHGEINTNKFTRPTTTIESNESQNPSIPTQKQLNTPVKQLRSHLSNIVEIEPDDDSISISSMTSSTPPTSVTTSVSSSINNIDWQNSRKLYGSGTYGVISPTQQIPSHDQSRGPSISSSTHSHNSVNSSNPASIYESNLTSLNPYNNATGHEPEINPKSYQTENSLNESIINSLDYRAQRRQSGPLTHPAKDRPAPPKTRKPSISKLPSRSLESGSIPLPIKLPGDVPFRSDSSRGFSVNASGYESGKNINSNVFSPKTPPLLKNDQMVAPMPLSPLDKLSQGLMSLSLQQAVVSTAQQSLPRRSTPSSTNSQLSINSQLHDSLAGENYHSSIISTSDDNSVHVPLTPAPTDVPRPHLIDEDRSSSPLLYDNQEHYQAIHSDPSITNDYPLPAAGLVNSNSSVDRSSTVSSIGKSLQRIKTASTLPKRTYNTDSHEKVPSHFDQLPTISDQLEEKQDVGNSDESDIDDFVSTKQTIPMNSHLPASSIATQETAPRPSRGNQKSPPKPLPPSASLTETLISSGQADIAYQVMMARRAQAAGVELIPGYPPVPQYSKQPLRKPKKNINVKNISTPKLLSASSNVKSIPIVQLEEHNSGNNTTFRRKFSLRDSDSGLSKFSRKLKDVFSSDGESNRFGKKNKSVYDTPNSSSENLPRRFISDDNLRHRYVTKSHPEMTDTRRAHSTWEKGVIQEHDSIAYFVNKNDINIVMEKGPDVPEEHIPPIHDNRWVVSDSELVKEPGHRRVVKKSESNDRLRPLYDIDGIRRHAEMIKKYSSDKKAEEKSRNSQSETSESLSGRDSSRDMFYGEEELAGGSMSSLPLPKLDVSSKTLSQTNRRWSSNSRDTSPVYSPVSPSLSTHSDAYTATPPPIAPRNPFRGQSNPQNARLILQQRLESQKKQQQQKPTKQNSPKSEGVFKRNSSASSGTSDGSDKRTSKEPRGTRSSGGRLLSIFNNRPNSSGKRSSENGKNRNSNGSVTDHLQVPQAKEESDPSKKPKNKVIRRTIILTKSTLPPLPGDVESDLAASETAKAIRLSRQTSLRRKKVSIDGKLHTSSDGRKWYLTKEGDYKESSRSISRNSTTEEHSDVDNNSSVSETNGSNNLAIPIPKLSINHRPPTPVPSPGTRASAMEPPFGIPIPPIPDNHQSFLSSKTPAKIKRSSKASMASSVSSSASRKRKSQGSKSVYSMYGESIYDYYDYSDQSGADDEDEEDETRKSEHSDDGFRVAKNDIGEVGALIPIDIENNDLVEQIEQEQHMELLEMEDGSLIWQVVNGLRSEEMNNRYSYFYNAGDEEEYNEQHMWPKEFRTSDDDSDVRTLDSRLSNLDYYQTYPSPLQLPGVQQGRISHDKRGTSKTHSVGSTFSYDDGTPINTEVFIAKDIPLPKLWAEMTKGLATVNFGDGIYGYLNEDVDGSDGNLTVEERLEQAMRALTVDNGEAFFYDE